MLTGKRLIAVISACVLLGSQAGCSAFPITSTRCTLGVAGSPATTVTYDGPGAREACDQIKQNQQFVSVTQEPTSIPVVCDVSQGPIHVRVRDASQLKAAATQLCQTIKQGGLPLG